MKTISAKELVSLNKNQNLFILDVRDHDEFVSKHIPESTTIPLDELQNKVNELPKDQTIYLLCQCGNRSAKALQILNKMGFNNTVNVEGGIEKYEKWENNLIKMTKIFSLSRQAQICYALLTLAGIILAYLVHPNFIWFSVVIASGLFIAGITGFCVITTLIIKMPWNKDYRA